jgi:lysophospholipase L1-like esterase
MNRVLTILVVALTCWACDMAHSSTEPDPLASSTTYSYTAVGASDAIGYGGSAPCVPFTECPNGTGYVQTIARRLHTSGKTVDMLNLGIPGAVLGPETQALGNSMGAGIFGNFLEQEVPFVGKNAALVTVFAGGNDVNTVGSALDAGLGGADPLAYVASQTTSFGHDLNTLVSGARSRAPGARIVMLNLPNMGALPYSAGYTVDRRRWLQTISVSFSSQINALASHGVLVIDLMCDSTFYQPSMFSPDGFHPNDTGYAHIADLMYAAATSGTAPAPRSSCSKMTIY